MGIILTDSSHGHCLPPCSLSFIIKSNYLILLAFFTVRETFTVPGFRADCWVMDPRGGYHTSTHAEQQFLFYLNSSLLFQSLHCVLIYVSFICLYFFCVYLSLTSCSVLAYISVSFLLVISCFNLKAAVLCYLILVLLLSFCWLSASCFHLRCFRPLFCPRHCSVLQLAFCVHTAHSLPLSDLFIISLNFCLFVCVPSPHKPALPPSVQVPFFRLSVYNTVKQNLCTFYFVDFILMANAISLHLILTLTVKHHIMQCCM